MRAKFLALSLSFVLILVLGVRVSAQEFRGTINGTVTDPAGGAVSGAKVHVTNVETGVGADTTSNQDGLYEVPFLLPGTYSVTVEADGFKKTERSGIRVDANAKVTVDLKLVVGSVNETVTVSGAPPLLDKTDAELSLAIPHTEVVDQGASIYRNAANFVRLAPGVVGQSTGTYTSDNQEGVQINGGGGALNVGANAVTGNQGGANEWVLDGVPDTTPESTGEITVVPAVDATQEMKVDTTMIDASHGHTTGGAIDMVTKSGTNDLHGTAYAFGRDRWMFANTWANDHTNTPKPSEDYTLWGYTAGGPVEIPGLYHGRNKTFWFSALERDYDVRDLTETGVRLPTAAEASGNFSSELGTGGSALTLYNPYSGSVNSSGAYVSGSRVPFQCLPGTSTPEPVSASGLQTMGTACAIIPPALINASGQAVLNYAVTQATKVGSYIPGATDEIGKPNWQVDSTYQVDQLNLDERIDHIFSDKQRAFVRYSRVDRDQFATPLIQGAQQYNASGSNLDTYLSWRDQAVVNDTYAFSPTFLGSFTFGFTRRSQNDSYGSWGNGTNGCNCANADANWNLPAILTANQYILGMPSFNDNANGSSTGGNGEDGVSLGSRATLFSNNTYSFFATFSKEKGKHTLQFGVDFRNIAYNSESQAIAAAGSFIFSGVFTTASPTTSAQVNSGSGEADMLLGLPQGGSLAQAAPLYLKDDYLGLYLEDTWKFTRKLTVTVGLRYDLETPYTERNNNVAYGFSGAPLGINTSVVNGASTAADQAALVADANAGVIPSFNPNLSGGLVFTGVNGAPRTEGRLDPNNLGPRLGFAYQLFSKTVIRGGYALFYSPMSDILSDLGAEATFSPSTPYTDSTTSNALPAGFTPGTTVVTNGGQSLGSLITPSAFTSISNPFPTGIVPTLGASQGLQSLIGQSISFLNPNRVSPYNQQFNFNVEQELPGQVVLTVAAIHVLSVKELESINLNDLPLPLNTASNSTASVPNPFKGLFLASPGVADNTATNINPEILMTAFPQFGSVTEDGMNSGTTQYNALQATVEKRVGHGLSVIGTWAWQKTMHNNVESLVNYQYLHNYLDTGYIPPAGGAAVPTMINWRSIGEYDQPKVLRLSVVYMIPVKIGGTGFGRSFLRESLAGWELTNWYEDASGLPLAITGASGFGRPAIICDPAGTGAIDQRLGSYFNQACFQQLNGKYFPVISPTAPYSPDLRAPGLNDMNTSLMKSFSFGERVHAQFRAEAYNTLNHPFFNAPSLSCGVSAGAVCTNSGNFGVITGASNSRQMQLGLKLIF